MNPSLLDPDYLDPALFARYLAGTNAFDKRWSEGERCPSNPEGARCYCDDPKEAICKIWKRLEEISTQIGGATAKVVGGMK